MKPHSANRYKVIGTMSGTSLDGLDLAAVEFWQENGKWKFELKFAETKTYSQDWFDKLKNAPVLSGSDLMQLHTEYGKLTGQEINEFIRKYDYLPDLIASHGHTVFHRPEKGFTFQLGHGANIAAETGIVTVADFRTSDVALGGQGAPLVPPGDEMLFRDYDCCLNLGGFANISYEKKQCRIAFDICPVNIILNYFAQKSGMAFDKEGKTGRSGKINFELLDALNNIAYYRQVPPKSLGREWLEKNLLPVLTDSASDDNDKMRTIYEHIAEQITQNLSGKGKVLITGGGAFNSFLIDLIKNRTQAEIIIPDAQIVNYKEAIVFAFLGLLRSMNKVNCYASVTGARKDSSAGIINLP